MKGIVIKGNINEIMQTLTKLKYLTRLVGKEPTVKSALEAISLEDK